MSRPKLKALTFKMPEYEFEALEEFCTLSHRGKTDVLRELVRSLPTYRDPVAQATAETDGDAPNGENQG